jgi:hypothetical protein
VAIASCCICQRDTLSTTTAQHQLLHEHFNHLLYVFFSRALRPYGGRFRLQKGDFRLELLGGKITRVMSRGDFATHCNIQTYFHFLLLSLKLHNLLPPFPTPLEPLKHAAQLQQHVSATAIASEQQAVKDAVHVIGGHSRPEQPRTTMNREPAVETSFSMLQRQRVACNL